LPACLPACMLSGFWQAILDQHCTLVCKAKQSKAKQPVQVVVVLAFCVFLGASWGCIHNQGSTLPEPTLTALNSK
jgi:hypothetical protein